MASNSNGHHTPHSNVALGGRSSVSSGAVAVCRSSQEGSDGATCLPNGDSPSLIRRDMRDDCGLRALQLSLRNSSGPSFRRRDDEVYQSLCYVTFKLQVTQSA